jgi:hypothetical protein
MFEIDTAGYQADHRHNDAVRKGPDDGGECCAHDKTDRQVEHIAAGDEFLEITYHFSSSLFDKKGCQKRQP